MLCLLTWIREDNKKAIVSEMLTALGMTELSSEVELLATKKFIHCKSHLPDMTCF